MKKVELLVAATCLVAFSGGQSILAAKAQQFSSVMLSDSNRSADSSSSNSSSSSDSIVPSSAPAAEAAGSKPSSATSSASTGSVVASPAPSENSAAMAPSPTFPFNFGSDGKASLNGLPPSMHKAAASAFAKLLKEKLLTPGGLFSMAFNRSPGSSPTDLLQNTGKLDGLMMIIAFVGSKVELSDAQIEALVKVRNTMIDKAGAIDARLLTLERKFRDQLVATELDDREMRSVRRQMTREKDKLDALMTEHMIASAHVFTPDQRTRVRELFMRLQAGPLGIKHPAGK